jgi:flagellar biogenesis protein FliO
MTPLGRYVVETVVTLILISGLAILVLYAARRSGVGRALGPITLAGRLVLDPRRAIYLVRIGETYFVVGASEAGLTKLGELGGEAVGDIAPTEQLPAPPAFRDFLERLGARSPRSNADTKPEKPHGG